MTGYSDDAKVMELFAPLGRIEPLPFAVPEGPRRRLRRPVLVTAVVVAALALTGVAIANGVGAFNGIGAAQRPQTGVDALDPQTLAMRQQLCASASSSGSRPILCQLVLASARLVRTLPSGRKVWVLTDTRGDLCVLLQDGGSDCASTLSGSHPTTLTSFKKGPGDPLITYGVALDGVAAVSFVANGQTVTVPVQDNVWAFEGPNSAFDSLTVHYTDGTTTVLSY